MPVRRFLGLSHPRAEYWRRGRLGRVPSGGGATFDLDFYSGVVDAARLAAAGFTFTRATAAWDSGLNSYVSGAPRIISGSGLLIEGARTSKFLNNTAPVTQSIASLAGQHICWITGSGSVTLSGGATGVVTAGSPVVFTPAGTVTFTVSGTVTFCQVENASTANTSSPIVTAGSAVTRNVDVCQRTTGLSNSPYTLLMHYVPHSASPACFFYGTQKDGSNIIYIRPLNSTQLNIQLRAAGTGYNSYLSTYNVGALNKSAFSYNPGVSFRAAINGTLGTAFSGAAYDLGAAPIKEAIGSDIDGSSPSFGYVRRVVRWPYALPDAQLQALTV